MAKIRFHNSFYYLLNHLNEAHVMESLALCRYIHIYQPLKKENITPNLLLSDTRLHESIIDNYFVQILGGDDYSCIRAGYLHFTENIFIDFFKLKFSLNYPNEKIATCPNPENTKKSLINYINNIVHNKKNINLTENQKSSSKKYEDYVFFIVRHIISYCSQFDNDFTILGQDIFEDFNDKKNSYHSNIHNLISGTLNEHFDKYIELKKQNNNNNCYLFINDERVQNLYHHIVINEPINNEIFKLKLNSHKKGLLGENLFGQLTESEVVGYKNNKTDIIEDGKNISLKTSYSSSWNHHLAYLNNENNSELIEALQNHISFSKLKNINWTNTILQLISGNDSIDELVFQKVTLDELNKKPKNIKYWRFNKDNIVNLIINKQFIFQNNNIILFHEQEQFLKLHFKKRTDIYQVMVSVEEKSLLTLADIHFGVFSEHTSTQLNLKMKNIN